MTTISQALKTLTADEIAASRGILERAGLVSPTTHFSYVGLVEPDKRPLLESGTAERQVRSMLVDMATNVSHDVVVSLAEDRVVSTKQLDHAVDGQVPVVVEEFHIVDVIKEHPDWQAAMVKRGLTDFSKLLINPLSAGVLSDRETGRRLQRCFTFVMDSPDDLGWAHPVDGVTVILDMVTKEVLEVLDIVELPVPLESGNFHLESWRTANDAGDRQGLKPIEISQPEGPSFTIADDGTLSWAGWNLQVGFDQREGLVFHNITIDDAGVARPVIYRASIAEMMVPYGDPSPQRWFQNFFDCGEYLLGGYANSLELGCDCVGDITYLDATVAGNDGNVHVIPQAICIHEEDDGIAWKHFDNWNGSSISRRNRRLVVSFFVTVGNYDYGFYWYFSLDGKIEFEVKATGVVFTSAYPGDGYPFASELAPGLGAPYHQHLFSARLDMMVDGLGNAVDELEARLVPRGDQNPTGTGFTQSVTRLTTESHAQRMADNLKGRTWLISNPSVQNRLGRDVGWVLYPEGLPTLIADAESDIHQRATFSTKHLWVTQYEPTELYPAGDYVNMHPGGAGLPSWTKADRNVDDADIVLWHTFGLTHFPRVEDWPVMPVDTCGFVLKPHGFFGRNPALDIPETTSEHCAPGHTHADHEHTH